MPWNIPLFDSTGKVKDARVFADLVVQADGLGPGGHTEVDATLALASPNDIVEMRANTPGGSQTFGETIDWPSGTAGNYIELRGRADDTIIVQETSTATDRATCKWDGVSYLKLNNFQLGDGIGWDCMHTSNPRGQSYWRNISAENTHHIWLKDLIIKGASGYTANRISDTCDHWFIENCTGGEHGSNAYQKAPFDDTGDFWVNSGRHMFYKGGGFILGGHDVHNGPGSYMRWEDYTFDGGHWTQALIDAGMGAAEAATYPGTRCVNFYAGEAGQWDGADPWGHQSITRCVIKNAGPSADNGSPSVCSSLKFHANFIQFYDNLFYDGVENRISARSRQGSSNFRSSSIRVFHNTHYNNDRFGDMNDNNVVVVEGVPRKTMDDHQFKNNIYAQMQNAKITHQVQKNCGDLNLGYTYNDGDGWLDDKFDNNLWEMVSGTFQTRCYPSQSAISNIGIAAVEADHAGWTNNNDSPTITYVDASARTRAGFVQTSGSDGFGTAVALTTAAGGGSGTTITLTDPLWFFCADTYGMNPSDGPWGSDGPQSDWIKVGSNSPVQILTLNYTTGVATVSASITWNDNDDVFMVKQDGVTVFDDIGIKE